MTDQKKAFDSYVKGIKQKQIDLDIKSLLVRKRRQNWAKMTLIPAVSLLLAFFVSVNTIPAFARSISNIPFLKGFVELLYLGEGIEEAIANEYYQEINETQTQGDVSVTIEAIMVDEYSYIVFYRIVHGVDEQYRFRLEDLDGVAVSYSSDVENRMNAALHFSAHEKKDFHDFTFTIVLYNEDKQLSFPFALPMDGSQVAKAKEFNIQQTLMVEGAVIELEGISVSPTRASLKIKQSEHGNYYVRSVDYAFVGEDGSLAQAQMNGIGGWGDVNEDRQFLIESKYFDLDAYSMIKITGFELVNKAQYQVEYDVVQDVFYNLSDNFYDIHVDRNQNEFTITYRLHEYIGTYGDILRPAMDYESASFGRSVSQNNAEFTLTFVLAEVPTDVIPFTSIDAIYVPYEMELSIGQ